MVKYRIDRFYLTYDPSSLDKVCAHVMPMRPKTHAQTPDLVNHICSGKYPFNVVLNKMCARFADQGAVLANWGDDYPIAMRQVCLHALVWRTQQRLTRHLHTASWNPLPSRNGTQGG